MTIGFSCALINNLEAEIHSNASFIINKFNGHIALKKWVTTYETFVNNGFKGSANLCPIQPALYKLSASFSERKAAKVQKCSEI